MKMRKTGIRKEEKKRDEGGRAIEMHEKTACAEQGDVRCTYSSKGVS